MARGHLSAAAVLGTIGLLAFTPRCHTETFQLLPVESGGSAGTGGSSGGANSNSGGKPSNGGATSGGASSGGASSGGFSSAGTGGKPPQGFGGRASAGSANFGGRPASGGDGSTGPKPPRPECVKYCSQPPDRCERCDPTVGCGPGKICGDCEVCVECDRDQDCRDPNLACDENKRCTPRCASGQPPGQPPCTFERPFCRDSICVECERDFDCERGADLRNICDTSRNVCVECFEDFQCPSSGPNGPKCNRDRMVCSECGSSGSDRCASGICRERSYCECENDEQCAFSPFGKTCFAPRCGCVSTSECQFPAFCFANFCVAPR